MVLKITSNAMMQLKQIFKQDHIIKVFVSSGGCSGVQWNMKHIPINEINKSDEQVNKYLVVDSVSVFHLLGSTLDYNRSLKASEFIINNPNAVHSCGCGKSFSTN